MDSKTIPEELTIPVRWEQSAQQETIWKFPVSLVGHQTIEVPCDAVPLCVQVQHEVVCIWYRVSPDAPAQFRSIYIHETGHDLSPNARKYIGTFQIRGGRLVFHVFEGMDASK